MNELTDDELMTMFRNGDIEAFDTLFARHHVSVYNFARFLLGDAHRAEDALQETFLSAARAARRYEPRGHFRTWLMRICRNGCLNLIQREKARANALAGSDMELVEAADDATPARRVEANENMMRVRRAIGRLPERQREAIALLAFEQMSYREIADVLGVPIGTVKTLIHRARTALAQELEHV